MLSLFHSWKSWDRERSAAYLRLQSNNMVELGFNPYLLGLACTTLTIACTTFSLSYTFYVHVLLAIACATFSLSYTFSVHVLLLPVLYSLMKWSLSIMKNFQPQKTAVWIQCKCYNHKYEENQGWLSSFQLISANFQLLLVLKSVCPASRV